MEVLCKGYKTCKNNIWCHHAIPHNYDEASDSFCFDETDFNDEHVECCCNKKTLREYKLKKLENYESR